MVKATSDSTPRLVRATKSTFARHLLDPRVSQKCIVPAFTRRFSSSQRCRNENNNGSESRNEKKEIPPEWWIGALEATANAPWLFHLPNEKVDRLKRAFTLIFQIILYLGRPQEIEKAQQFLNVSGNAFSRIVINPFCVL